MWRPGRRLIESVLEAVQKHPTIVRVYLHVQTSNDSAQAFYSRFGFSASGVIEGYYKHISPPDAVLLEKLVNVRAAAAVDASSA